MKANPTLAKDVALYFLDVTNQRYTSSIVAKTINQAKQLLIAGYTKEEIIECIDWVLDNTKVEMYSLGYINTMINKILDNIKEDKVEKEKQIRLEKYKLEMQLTQQEFLQKEVNTSEDESKERNRRKLEEFGNSTGFREKHYFDLFEESGKDN